MFEIFPPQENYKDEFLDDLLDAGWFRMGQDMFTTDGVADMAGRMFEAHWFRYNIGLVTAAFYNKRNYKKLHAKYSVTYHPLHEVDKQELEALYALYHSQTIFAQSDSLGDVLGNYSDKFNSHAILVRDEGALIAAGISASTRSACNGAGAGMSKAVFEMTKDRDRAISTVRFTLSPDTTKGDVAYAVQVIKEHLRNSKLDN